MNILDFIETAFVQRPRPDHVIDSNAPPTELTTDALAFDRLDWRELNCAILEQRHDAVFGFSAASFCYFLPGIFSAGIRESRPDLLVNYSLITTLDRGNSPASWDDFFRARWPQLTPSECEATQRWILWLEEFDPPPMEDVVLTRAYDTLDILSNQNVATPLAGRDRK
jgi:hypothetical protein